MTTRDDIITEARRWIGTPFLLHGRSIGKGIDCIGLVSCVARNLGIVDVRTQSYKLPPTIDQIDNALARYCETIPLTAAKPGDIVTMAIGGRSQHVGILSDIGIIHCMQGAQHTGSEHGIDAKWQRRLRRAYRFPGITD